jgi:hypothetical protein
LAVHRTVTLRVPEAAVVGETVNQVADDELVQVMFAVTVTVPVLAAAVAVSVVGLTVNDGV